METTPFAEPTVEESIFNNRLLLRQPRNDFKDSLSSVFLAAAVQANPGETVMEVGAGIGATALCLALRCKGVRIIGLETNRNLVRYASYNIKNNSLKEQVEILQGDLLMPPPRLAAGTFPHIIVNMEWYSTHQPHNLQSKNHAANSVDLLQLVKFCLLMVRPKGNITIICSAIFLDHILSLFAGKLGMLKLFPLWPLQHKPADYVLINGIKGAPQSCQVMPGIVLRHGSGQYTTAAEQIIFHNRGVDW